MQKYAKHFARWMLYLLFEEYLQENTSFYILKPGREIGQSFKKKFYEEVSFLLRTNISHEW